MFQKLNRIINKTLGITEKELKLQLRFPFSFFFNIFIRPYIFLIPFLIIYMGLFSQGFPGLTSLILINIAERDTLLYYYHLYQFINKNFLSSINEANFLSWLLIGIVFMMFSRYGFTIFNDKFREEKYWNTIEGFLLAPINRYLMLMGYIIVILFQSTIVFIMLMTLCFLAYPAVTIIQILLVFLIACIVTIASCGFGLVSGAIFISTESFRSVFELIHFLILFLSCYNIAFEYFPEFLQNIIVFNPFYHAVDLARNIYYGKYTPNLFFSLGYLIIFSIIVSLLGVYLFNKIWKKYGIHG